MLEEKSIIRHKMLDKRNTLSAMEILEKSNRVIENLSTMEDFARAKVVMPYISFGTEVNTHGLIRSLIEDKKVLVPVVADREGNKIILSELRNWKELSSGAYGILEPRKEFMRERDASKVDISIVPGITFDVHGNRIGYGGGYYDRLLMKAGGIKVGIAYDFQVLDRIPSEGHDIEVDKIVTDKKIISVTPSMQ